MSSGGNSNCRSSFRPIKSFEVHDRMNSLEKYFIEKFDINHFSVRVRIFHEEMNCNKLSFTFSRGEIYFGTTIVQYYDGGISHYGLYCNILRTDAKKIFSEKFNNLIQKGKVIKLLNNAIEEEKARVEKAHAETQKQRLIQKPKVNQILLMKERNM